jgi:hypothetical protein
MKLLYFTKLSKKSISKELKEYVKGIENVNVYNGVRLHKFTKCKYENKNVKL